MNEKLVEELDAITNLLAMIKELAQENNELRIELERVRSRCKQHMHNIKTWMREGFDSHCTDAVMILGYERDQLRDQLDALKIRHRIYADGIAAAIGDNREQTSTGEPANSDRVEIMLMRAKAEAFDWSQYPTEESTSPQPQEIK